MSGELKKGKDLSEGIGEPSKEAPDAEKNQYIFFSEAEKLAVGGLYPEERYPNGDIKKPARFLKFSANLFATSNEMEAQYLREKIKDDNFITKIVECKDMEEYRNLLRLRNAKKVAEGASGTEHTITETGDKIKIVPQVMK